MGFLELSRRLNVLNNGLFATYISEILNQDSVVLEELQKDQLYAGQTAEGKTLSPSYYADPFFKNPLSAAKYALYKDRLIARTHNPIFAPKQYETPNLIVTGKLVYDTIFARTNGNKSLTIDANSPIIANLLSKYREPFGLNQTAWDYYTRVHLVPKLTDKVRNYLYQ